MIGATILDAALAAHAAGISIVPPAEDGSKRPLGRPDGTWDHWKITPPALDQVLTWYRDEGRTGIGHVCGSVSGNLEMLEAESEEVYQAYRALLVDHGIGDLIDRVEGGYCERTPGGGRHLHYYCHPAEKSSKLARRPNGVDENGRPKIQTLVETKGEGGFTVASPSNGRVHRTGRAYALLSGGVDTIVTITPDERDALWSIARMLDEMPIDVIPDPSPTGTGNGTRPGDDFNERGNILPVLEEAGWKAVRQRGEIIDLRRPGKDHGTSATLNYRGSRLFYSFTSSTTFEPDKGYSPWRVYAVLEHGGDFKAAARALREQGYGSPAPKPTVGGKRTTGPTATGAKPQLLAQDMNLPRLSAECWGALIAANKPERMFLFGDMPTRLDRDDGGAPIPQALTEDRLHHEVARAADWVRMVKDPTSGEMVLKDGKPPRDVIRDMLAAPSFPLPGLRSIVHAPVFAPDKTLHCDPGYHPAGQTYLHLARGFSVPEVAEQPTVQDVEEARRLIEDELLGDFPFVSQADRANAIALFLVPYVRNLINGPTPLNLIEAPTMGSGKGLLVNALLRPAVGAHLNLMPAANDDDEWRKRIHGQLVQAPAVILIDNITSALDSGSLASVLTTTMWSDRRLGSNQIVHMPVRCVWIATANNPTMTTELARRSVRIRIDPKVDRPWQRGEESFRHPDLRQWADEHRGELVAAALTLVRNWIAQGAHLGAAHLGSFEQWSQTMGGILASAGIPKFLGNLDAFYEEADLEGTVWRQFIGQWFEKHETSEVGVADLFDLALSVDGFDFGKGSERSQKVVFGTALNRQRDRVIGKYRVINTRTVQRVKRWRLMQVDVAANPFAGLYDDQDGGDDAETDEVFA